MSVDWGFTFMIEMACALMGGLAGIVVGWFLRSAGSVSSNVAVATDVGEHKSIDFNLVAQQILDLTHEVAADVDLHQERVRAADDAIRQASQIGSAPNSLMQAITSIVEANRDMQSQLDAAREKLETQAEELQSARQNATTDPLTHLRNRRALDEHLESRHKIREKVEHPTCLALFDVDHFKQFNDTYGHQAGDQVLRKVASVLHARLHQYGIAARYGGEEFAVVLDDQTASQIAPAIEAVRGEISRREIEVDGARLRVTVSCGVSQLQSTDSLEQWLERADEALYHSKHQGRNQGYLNDNGKMIPLAGETGSSREAQSADAMQQADELLLAGEQLHQNLSQRRIPLTAVVFVVDGSVTAADEVERQIRLQSRGIDRMGRLSSHEMGLWMPSTNIGAAKEWLKKFSMSLGRNEVLKGQRGTQVKVGCSVADPELAFAEAIKTARQNVGPI